MKLFRELLPKNLLRFGISKRADHEYIVYRKAVNFKGKTAYGWKSCRLLLLPLPLQPLDHARKRKPVPTLKRALGDWVWQSHPPSNSSVRNSLLRNYFRVGRGSSASLLETSATPSPAAALRRPASSVASGKPSR